MIPDRLEFLTDADLPPMQLARIFADAGEEIYLVGGSVRDAILGNDLGDFDFATSARPDRVTHLLERWAGVVYQV